MADPPGPPCLRPVEAFPLTLEGQDVICLRDPSGVTDAVLAVPRGLAAILALLDGTRSLLDVQAEIMRRHGELVPRSALETLVEALDQHCLLEGPRVEAERRRLADAFRATATRAAAHAGRAYPDEAGAAARALDELFLGRNGLAPVGPTGEGAPVGLIAPHIDFGRGGPAYARAYHAVGAAAAVDCFIVLGTAHAGLDGHAFAATRKAYDTPFGPLAVDDEVLEAVVRRAPADLFAAELAHRAEHSIEFQAVCLAYLHRNGAAAQTVRIVPILTSFVHECLARQRDPAEETEVMGVLDALRGAMAAVPRRYCVIAGADLAHVGPRFGDPAPVSRERLRAIEAEDRTLLALVARGDAAGFFGSVAREGDRRRICGLSPIYALLATLPPCDGQLLSYGQWPDPQGTVTFASLVFREGRA
jgi:AmmeMemoRadiSam system protein B